MEDHSINISEKKIQISQMTWQKLSISTFQYKSMGNISCHSNQSSYPTGIKNTTYVEANVLSTCTFFFASTPLWFLRRRFFNIFTKNDLLLPRQPIKFTDLDESHMKRREILNKHFCEKNPNISNETEKIVNLLFSHHKSLGIWEP